MLLITLINYKEKKVTSKSQRENKKEVIEKLTKSLNKSGTYVLNILQNKDPQDRLYSHELSLEDEYINKCDDLLVEILGSSEAVDVLYNRIR